MEHMLYTMMEVAQNNRGQGGILLGNQMELAWEDNISIMVILNLPVIRQKPKPWWMDYNGWYRRYLKYIK